MKGRINCGFHGAAKFWFSFERFTRCKRESPISGADTFRLYESISSLPCTLLPFIFFIAFLSVVILIFLILNSGGGSALLLSQSLSLVAGSISAAVAVFCLSSVILFLKYLLKIFAIFKGFVIISGDSSPSFL